MSCKAVIFDFNGVLWWDTHLQLQSWEQFSEKIKGMPLSAAEMDIHVHGRNNRHTLEYITGRSLSDIEVYELTRQKETAYRRLCLEQGENFQLSPGAVGLLDLLALHEIPHTIATASEITNMRFFFEELHLNRWFSLENIVYDDGTRPGKPAPDIYLQAAENLRKCPIDCMVIEDSRSGIEAAVAAGIGCVIALAQKADHKRLAQINGVTHVIEHLGQITLGFLIGT